ncbi:MAG: hypothetical protein KIS66_14975 [Fimbriimonadaceae bacterium]|nr:hypothetical protein [Fimbriimonadaceae bacterium]
MQKKTTPWIMLAILVVLVGAAGIMNATSQTDPNQPPQAPVEGQGEAVGASRNAPDKGTVAKALTSRAQKPGEMAGGMPEDMKTNRPSILKSESLIQKPTVNDATTTSQWYTNRTHLESKKGD